MRGSAPFLFLTVSLAACGGVVPSGTSATTHDGGGHDAASGGHDAGGGGQDAALGTDASSREAGRDGASSCVTTFLEAGTGRQGDAEVPIYHRAAASCCSSARGRPAGEPYPSGQAAGCSTDSDCTDASDGSCFPFEGLVGPGGCSYDQCLTDSDCPSGAPCICRTSTSDLTANICATRGNCVLDSDCGPGGFCSPSVGPCDYVAGGQSALAGAAYFCHTDSDTCTNDADCSPPPGDAGEGCPMVQACEYDTLAKHWACVSDSCCPP
jgi:hypothetical protein